MRYADIVVSLADSLLSAATGSQNEHENQEDRLFYFRRGLFEATYDVRLIRLNQAPSHYWDLSPSCAHFKNQEKEFMGEPS